MVPKAKPRAKHVAWPWDFSKPSKPKRANANKRVEPLASESSKRGPKKPKDPAEFKARNRTILLLLVLGFINAWIFVWREDGGRFDRPGDGGDQSEGDEASSRHF